VATGATLTRENSSILVNGQRRRWFAGAV